MSGTSPGKIVAVLVATVVFTSLVPTIANQIAGVGGNVTGAALTMIQLVTLFVAIGFVIGLAKSLNVL